MKLLDEQKLAWSPTVANCRMNRERNSSGINSYEQELKFKPEAFLQERIEETGTASWLDLCCGHGKALAQAAEYLYKKSLQDHVKLVGVDLIGDFIEIDPSIKNLRFERGTVTEMKRKESYDLVTCVHGFHYLGDKLKVIEAVVSSLKPNGRFIANLDVNNIAIKGRDAIRLKTLFEQNGLSYSSRTKLLTKTGPSNIHFGLQYLGADDGHGPNYTGQDSVTSYYSL
jgi:SAM-dependent methyltransferase